MSQTDSVHTLPLSPTPLPPEHINFLESIRSPQKVRSSVSWWKPDPSSFIGQLVDLIIITVIHVLLMIPFIQKFITKCVPQNQSNMFVFTAVQSGIYMVLVLIVKYGLYGSLLFV